MQSLYHDILKVVQAQEANAKRQLRLLTAIASHLGVSDGAGSNELGGSLKEAPDTPSKHQLSAGVTSRVAEGNAAADVAMPAPRTASGHANWREHAESRAEAEPSAASLNHETMGMRDRYALHESLSRLEKANEQAIALAGRRTVPIDEENDSVKDRDGAWAPTDWSKLHCGRLLMHPASLRWTCWTGIGMLVLLYDLVEIPLRLAFPLRASGDQSTLDVVAAAFWTADIVANFMVGYIERDGTEVMCPRRMCLRYMKGWLPVDVFIVGIDWVSALAGPSALHLSQSAGLARVLRFSRMIRIARIGRIRKFFDELRELLDSEELSMLLGVVYSICCIILLSHMLACMWFALGCTSSPDYRGWVDAYDMYEEAIEYQYLASLHWSVTQFTPASMHIQPHSVWERLFAISMVLLGMVVFSSFVSNITSSVTHFRQLGAVSERQRWLLKKFLKQHSISYNLSMRINRYASFVHSAQAARVQQRDIPILTELSMPLSQELKTELFAPFLIAISAFDILSNESHEVIRHICNSCISHDLLSEGDAVFRVFEVATGMFVSMRGVLRYRRYLAGNGKEDLRVEAKQEISEAALWTRWVHAGTMTALMGCDLLKVSGNGFREVLAEFPDAVGIWMPYATSFVGRLSRSQFCSDVLQKVEYPFMRYMA